METSTYLIILVILIIIGAVVKAVRSTNAASVSQTVQKTSAANTQSNRVKMNAVLQELNVSQADLKVVSDCAAIVYIREERKVVAISSKLPAGKQIIDLNDVDVIKLDDRSPNYMCLQEQTRIGRGITRANPNKYSTSTIKSGMAGFESHMDKLVFGVTFIFNDRHTMTVPVFCGDGDVYWNKDVELNATKVFVDNMRKELREVQRERASVNNDA